VFVEPEDLLWCLKQEDASAYHPTARYRMLMYLIHHWGHDVLKQKLRADTAVNPELAAAIAPD
jgi:hypothetical protein